MERIVDNYLNCFWYDTDCRHLKAMNINFISIKLKTVICVICFNLKCLCAVES